MTETGSITTIPAANLRPGDIVCDDHGVRRFAAFDVDHQRVDGMATVWTAIADQDAGQPERLLVCSDDLLTVRRSL